MKKLCLSLLLGLAFFSCKKKVEVPIDKSDIQLNWNHGFNGHVIPEDSLAFVNVFDDTLSISRITYFLSGFKLIGNHAVYTSEKVFLVDYFGMKNLSFTLDDIPYGDYHTLEFNFGLDPSINVFGLLTNALENNEMFWPSSMGGGYHFMKFEGHYLDSGKIKGYALHIGKNGNHVNYSIPIQLNVPGNNWIIMDVRMDEWLKNPYAYSFSKDGAFTMAYDHLMQLVVKNGKDVFVLKNLR